MSTYEMKVSKDGAIVVEVDEDPPAETLNQMDEDPLAETLNQMDSIDLEEGDDDDNTNTYDENVETVMAPPSSSQSGFTTIKKNLHTKKYIGSLLVAALAAIAIGLALGLMPKGGESTAMTTQTQNLGDISGSPPGSPPTSDGADTETDTNRMSDLEKNVYDDTDIPTASASAPNGFFFGSPPPSYS